MSALSERTQKRYDKEKIDVIQHLLYEVSSSSRCTNCLVDAKHDAEDVNTLVAHVYASLQCILQ
jgi:hypothetical protein